MAGSGRSPSDRTTTAATTSYLECLNRWSAAAGSASIGIDSLRHLLEELRNRVQFIQTRAADIRLSHQLDRLVEVTAERVVETSEALTHQLEGAPEEIRQALTKDFEDGHGPLLQALINSLGRRSGAAGAALSLAATQAGNVLTRFTKIGVTGNLVTEALKAIAQAATAP